VGTFAAHRDTKRAFALRVQDSAVRGVEVDRRLGCRAIVVVMESADQRRRDDTPGRRRPDGAPDRRVLLECEMRSGPHVVRIEALTSDGPDDALDVGVLPR
jgi:hypothetical protein